MRLFKVMIALTLAAWACTSVRTNAHRGVVSAATPEAARAGAEVLELGGNAIDAAVAVAFALGVTEPAGSGIGGQAILLVHRPGETPVVVQGSSLSPLELPANAAESIEGRRASTVPSTVRTLDVAWRRFGSGRVPWARLLAPAIELAREGFVLGPFRQRSVARYEQALAAEPATSAVFLKEGKTPPVGHVVRQTALARTLQRLAEHGAADFYHGGIARDIARDMQQGGGWITERDLREFPEPAIVPALHSTYRGHDVYSLPPPAGGWVVQLALNVLEHARPQQLKDDFRHSIWMAEALRAAHDSRFRRPVGNLADYESVLRRRLDKSMARSIVQKRRPGSGGETTHFCVVDSGGMVVSASASLNAYFGCKTMSAGLGILYNDYMREFEADHPGHPFALSGGSMPYSSMSATIVLKDGRAVLAAGSPGSRRIISAVVQVVCNWIDRSKSIEQSVAAPRMHVVPEDDDLMLEARPRDRARLLELERRGFSIAVPLSSLFAGGSNPYFGGVQAVAFENGAWHGAADPRRDGAVREAVREPVLPR